MSATPATPSADLLASMNERMSKAKAEAEAKARNLTTTDLQNGTTSAVVGLVGAAGVYAAYNLLPEISAKVLVHGAPIVIGVVGAKKAWRWLNAKK